MSRLVDHFRAGTDDARAMLDLVLSQLDRVRWSKAGHRLYRFPAVGSRGVVVPGVDGAGRVGLAFYERTARGLHFKRRKVRSAACDRWLTLPTAWAHINGLRQTDLSPAETGEWGATIILAGGATNMMAGGEESKAA